MALTVSLDARLDRLNTLGVRASAARLVRVDDPADIDEALAIDAGRPRLVLGGGSNVLFTGDFDGTVLLIRTGGRRILGEIGDASIVEAQAGEPWDPFVRWTLAQGLCGLENLALIPGNVGASPIQNIGAYGVEVRDCFESLSAIDIDSGERREFATCECEFDYRDSVFKRAAGRRWLILQVRFRLTRQPRLRLDYGELRAELARAAREQPSASDVADAVSAIRSRKLPDPARLGNAGSFFKNPVLPTERAMLLLAAHPGLPHWPAGERTKLSAAWMIERCGWKGARDGDAGVHADHALVLVNHGNASGAQLVALAGRIRESVFERFEVDLEPEPVVV